MIATALFLENAKKATMIQKISEKYRSMKYYDVIQITSKVTVDIVYTMNVEHNYSYLINHKT